MADKKYLTIRVEGNVQGVGYRQGALSAARRFGVKGFIKNEKDGSVYIEARGKEKNLNEFVKWCYDGPPHARVLNVHAEEKEPSRTFDNFSVRY